ncbi:MAG: IS66 family transposase [Blastocatellia bacterium]|nr:IS66 family transposase [Blastocatellia bacterium]
MKRQIEFLTTRVAELEAKLGLPPKTPDNSSTPPSQGRKASGEVMNKPERKAHVGAHRPLHPNPAHKREVMASSCQHCGADVSGVAQTACETYDHVEIPDIKPDVTRVTLHGGVCPCCAKKFKAAPPSGMKPGSPFGENLRALVIYLRFTQGIAFERLARLLSDILGLEISEGALVNMLDAARDAFARQTSHIRARLMSGTILQSDETGLRVGKRNWWLWVFHHDDSAVFVVEPSRGKCVVEGFLGAFRPDFWVSDRYGGQMGWAKKDNQVCLAHLIRDVQYAIDAGDDIFAPDLRHLFGRACRIGRRRDKLADVTLKTYAARLEARLDELMHRTPTHKAGVKLQRVIKKIRRHMFVFITNRAIPATNNGSERALRPCVTFRKITNGFRTEWGARLYAGIRSVIETARRRAITALEAIRLTLAGKPLATAP